MLHSVKYALLSIMYIVAMAAAIFALYHLNGGVFLMLQGL